MFFKLPVNRYLAINIEEKIGQVTVIRTSSFIIKAKGKDYQIDICCFTTKLDTIT